MISDRNKQDEKAIPCHCSPNTTSIWEVICSGTKVFFPVRKDYFKSEENWQNQQADRPCVHVCVCAHGVGKMQSVHKGGKKTIP